MKQRTALGGVLAHVPTLAPWHALMAAGGASWNAHTEEHMTDEHQAELVGTRGMLKIERTFEDSLYVVLSDSEIATRARAMAERMQAKATAMAAKEAAAKEAKTVIEAIDLELRELATIVSSGRELRDVKCSLLRDDKLGIMITVREDDGSVISTRPMTAEEKQTSLFAIGGGKAKKSKKGHEPTSPDWKQATSEAGEPA